LAPSATADAGECSVTASPLALRALTTRFSAIVPNLCIRAADWIGGAVNSVRSAPYFVNLAVAVVIDSVAYFRLRGSASHTDGASQTVAFEVTKLAGPLIPLSRVQFRIVCRATRSTDGQTIVGDAIAIVVLTVADFVHGLYTAYARQYTLAAFNVPGSAFTDVASADYIDARVRKCAFVDGAVAIVVDSIANLRDGIASILALPAHRAGTHEEASVARRIELVRSIAVVGTARSCR